MNDMRTQTREYREIEAQQQDVVMEWQSKLHDKEQEVKIQVERYEKQIKSMQTELEEQDANLEQFKETI